MYKKSDWELCDEHDIMGYYGFRYYGALHWLLKFNRSRVATPILDYTDLEQDLHDNSYAQIVYFAGSGIVGYVEE